MVHGPLVRSGLPPTSDAGRNCQERLGLGAIAKAQRRLTEREPGFAGAHGNDANVPASTCETKRLRDLAQMCLRSMRTLLNTKPACKTCTVKQDRCRCSGPANHERVLPVLTTAHSGFSTSGVFMTVEGVAPSNQDQYQARNSATLRARIAADRFNTVLRLIFRFNMTRPCLPRIVQLSKRRERSDLARARASKCCTGKRPVRAEIRTPIRSSRSSGEFSAT